MGATDSADNSRICCHCRGWHCGLPSEVRPGWYWCETLNADEGNLAEASVICRDDGVGWIETAPEFGCVQFEEMVDGRN